MRRVDAELRLLRAEQVETLCLLGEARESLDYYDVPLQNLRRADPLVCGGRHRIHPSAARSGYLSTDSRLFTKSIHYDGRLSIITGDHVHASGAEEYAVHFLGGTLSDADGIGFVFDQKLPCTQNIQKIESVFLNRDGRICTRRMNVVEDMGSGLPSLAVGDVVMVNVDLGGHVVTFTSWRGGRGVRASVDYSGFTCNQGYLACVVKHANVTLCLCA